MNKAAAAAAEQEESVTGPVSKKPPSPTFHHDHHHGHHSTMIFLGIRTVQHTKSCCILGRGTTRRPGVQDRDSPIRRDFGASPLGRRANLINNNNGSLDRGKQPRVDTDDDDAY